MIFSDLTENKNLTTTVADEYLRYLLTLSDIIMSESVLRII